MFANSVVETTNSEKSEKATQENHTPRRASCQSARFFAENLDKAPALCYHEKKTTTKKQEAAERRREKPDGARLWREAVEPVFRVCGDEPHGAPVIARAASAAVSAESFFEFGW